MARAVMVVMAATIAEAMIATTEREWPTTLVEVWCSSPSASVVFQNIKLCNQPCGFIFATVF